MRRSCTCAQSRAPEPPSADPASRCARLAGTPRSTGSRSCRRGRHRVRSRRAWETLVTWHPQRQRPESVVARVAAREPANQSCSGKAKENAEMEKSSLDEIARLPRRCRQRQRLVKAERRREARAGRAASSSPLLQGFAAEKSTPLVLIWPICAGRWSAISRSPEAARSQQKAAA